MHEISIHARNLLCTKCPVHKIACTKFPFTKSTFICTKFPCTKFLRTRFLCFARNFLEKKFLHEISFLYARNFLHVISMHKISIHARNLLCTKSPVHEIFRARNCMHEIESSKSPALNLLHEIGYFQKLYPF